MTDTQQTRPGHLRQAVPGRFPVEAVSWEWPCLCQALQLCPAVCQVKERAIEALGFHREPVQGAVPLLLGVV